MGCQHLNCQQGLLACSVNWDLLLADIRHASTVIGGYYDQALEDCQS